MELTITLELRSVLLGLAALVGFGVAFNYWVASLERQGKEQGFVSLLVVVGVAVTGIMFGLIAASVEIVLLLAVCFLACGIPMVVGSISRYVRQRAAEEHAGRVDVHEVLQEAATDDQA